MLRFLFYGAFAVIGPVLVYAVHRYLWVRLVRDTAVVGRAKSVAKWTLVGLAVLLPLAMIVTRVLPRDAVQWLAYAGFVWLGALLYLLLILGTWDIVRSLARRSLNALGFSEAPTDPQRRLLLQRTVAITAVAATAAITVRGVHNALGEISTPEFEVRMPRLPRALSGLRIVQISDVHAGVLLDRRFLETVVEKTNQLSPDLIAITGDLVDASVGILGPDIEVLSRLKSRYGTFFVTGNHEYFSGLAGWLDFLPRTGMNVLVNAHTTVGDTAPGGAVLDIAGITDAQAHIFEPSHRSDLDAALAGRDPERPLLLLSHRPKGIEKAAAAGVGLQLSGHTHGGQIWPFGAAVALAEPYVAGLHQHAEDTWIYVSRGTGFWGPPMRIRNPAEITTIVLTN